MPKASSKDDARQSRRHNPLAEDYSSTASPKHRNKRRKSEADERDADKYVDAKSSRRILSLGQELAEENETEESRKSDLGRNSAFDLDERHGDTDANDEDQWEDETEETWGDDLGDVGEEEADPRDLEVFDRFNPTAEFNPSFNGPNTDQDGHDDGGGGTNLADLILAKIAEHEAHQNGGNAVVGGGVPEDAIELPAKVVEVYTMVGDLLTRFKSGKLPKAFKILPTVPEWEDLLAITRPDSWTPNAVLAATRIFISSKPHIAQTFVNEVLLPRVRDDIRETHKLNVHLYDALKKALYKPAAFFKGLLFPLLSSGTCTQREAHIVASALARVSVPLLHSAAALSGICDIAADQMFTDPDSAGAANYCIKILLDKKYALPYQVIDSLVFHFLRFKAASNAANARSARITSEVNDVAGGRQISAQKLPVIWHQSLLSFAQRYSNEITEDQREALLDLLLDKGHKDIGPEIRKALLSGRGRGNPVTGEDTAMKDT